MSELNELPPLMVGRGSDREDVHPAWRVWRSGQSKSVLLRPGETENELTRAYDAIVAEKSRTMSGNQPKKGLMPSEPGENNTGMSATRATPEVTGVAPHKVGCHYPDSPCMCDTITVIAPAPHPMSIENHGTPHWSSGAQPMSAGSAQEIFPRPSCHKCGTKMDYVCPACGADTKPTEPAQPMSAEAWRQKHRQEFVTYKEVPVYSGQGHGTLTTDSVPRLDENAMLEAYAAHQHAALMQRNAELDRWLNDAATLLRSDLDSVGKAAAALVAERDHLNESAKRLFSDNLATQQRAEAAELDLREAIGKEDQIRTLVEPFTNERANHVEMVRDALRRLQGGDCLCCRESGCQDGCKCWHGEPPAPPTAEPAKEGK